MISFLDGNGRVMLHPLLTSPVDIHREAWDKKDPVLLDIYTLEKASIINPVIDSMARYKLYASFINVMEIMHIAPC